MGTLRLLIIVAAVAATLQSRVSPLPASGRATPAAEFESLNDARRLFFNARYEAAAELTREACASGVDAVAACELRAAALLFQIKSAVQEPGDKQNAWKRCVACPELYSAFQTATARGQALARVRIRAYPDEDMTLFLLGKLSLNDVWLQTGTLGRKTGWSEYWEGRRSLDRVLKLNPNHVRARVARGWIDYIVATKVPRAVRWLLGGGNKKRGLLAVREAANASSDFFSQAEARFALWDMQVRERNLLDAVATARVLARDFPENEELSRFIQNHERVVRR